MSDSRRISIDTLMEQRPWVEALARTLVLDPATADDVVQETWITAIERPPREGSALRGWLARVVRNAAFESRRRAARRRRHETGAAIPATAAGRREDTVARAEAHRRLVDAVMSLAEPYRTAVLLRYFDGLESDEVARRMGVPVETARTRVKRAIAELRRRLDDASGGDGTAWTLALLPLASSQGRMGLVTKGGAAVAATTKMTAAGVLGLLLGGLLTAVAMSTREEDRSQIAAQPDPGPAALRRTLDAGGTNSRDPPIAPRRPTSRSASREESAENLLARALDRIAIELPARTSETISGRVTTPDGAPISGVLVVGSCPSPARTVPQGRRASPAEELRDAALEAKWRIATTREARTDAAGGYVLVDLLETDYEVVAAADACVFRAQVGTAGVTPRVRPGRNVDFVLSTVAVPIAVLQSDGTPLEGWASVLWTRPDAAAGAGTPRSQSSVESQSHGQARWTPDAQRVELPPGTWNLMARHGLELESPALAVDVSAAPRSEPIALRLEPTGVGRSPQDTEAPNEVIRGAFDWMRRQQAGDGGWHDPATTGIAVLAYLGAGETHQSGSNRTQVKSGLRFLRDAQDADGCLVARNAPRFLREQAMAGLALCEAYGMTGSRVFKEPAQRALSFALKTRTPGGAWNLPAPDAAEVDVEATAWMTALLKSAQLCDLGIDRASLEEIVSALGPITETGTGGVTPDRRRGALSEEAATAANVLARFLAGHTAKDDPSIRVGADGIVAHLPSWVGADGASDPAYWYLGTLAMYQMGNEYGRHWSRWNDALRSAVLDRQCGPDRGEAAGSWDPRGSATEDDRIRTTALCTLATEVWLRYGRALGVHSQR